MWVRGAVHSTMLVDGEDTLCTASSPAEGLLDGVPQDALAEEPVEPAEAVCGGVVHGQDEAEVDRTPETATVLAESLSDRGFVAPKGAVAFANAVELSPLPIGQPLLPGGDVANLLACSLRVSGIWGLHAERVDR